MSIRDDKMMSFEWPKPVATEMLVIRRSRSKSAANRAMIKGAFTWY